MTEIRFATQVVFVCPHCGGEIRVPGRLDGAVVRFDSQVVCFAALEHALGSIDAHAALLAELDGEE